MNNKYYNKNLNEGEELVEAIRCHPITMIGPMFIAGIFILIDFFFLVLLFSQGWWGVGVFIAVLSIVSVFALRTWIIWSRNVFIITNKRVIDVDQHGFFSKTVSECNYEKIQDVSYTINGLIATIFKFGSIKIQTAGEVANLELHFIKNPARVQEAITNQQRTAAVSAFNNNKMNQEEDRPSALPPMNSDDQAEILNKIFKK